MATQELRDAMFIGTDYRANFKQIIAKRSDQTVFMGGRMKPAGAGLTVTYYAGTVLGYATSGADAGFWKPYLVGSSDGSQVAKAVLSEDVITDQYGNGSEAALITRGILFNDLLIGLDSGAITNLHASLTVEHGVNLLSIYA